jgi:hypothetical protein
MDSSARNLSRQAAGRDLPASGKTNRDGESQKTETAAKTSESREQLEKRLLTLENELVAIRSQLAEEDSEKAADSDD